MNERLSSALWAATLEAGFSVSSEDCETTAAAAPFGATDKPTGSAFLEEAAVCIAGDDEPCEEIEGTLCFDTDSGADTVEVADIWADETGMGADAAGF